LPLSGAFRKHASLEAKVPANGILAMLLTAAVAHGGSAVGRPVVRVLVQAEGTLAGDPRMLGEIVQGAREIWGPYADVTFDVTGKGVGASGSLRLVMTDRVSAFSDGASLGWIEFVDGQPSNVITVSTGAATALMKASRWGGLPKPVQRLFLVRAMSRAIAHELGHYLLATRAHTRHGLMRGALTAEDVMQPTRSSYRLDRAEVERLQQGALVARQGALEEIQN
jgi:hypothetical protein